MRKEITREDGFNFAVINKYWEGGDCLCTLQHIETVDEVETVIFEQNDIVLKDGVDFTLTDEELEELNPKLVIDGQDL